MSETLISLLVWMTDEVWPFPVLILVLVLAVLLIARLMRVPQSSKGLLAVLVVLMLFIPFGTPALLIFGSSLTAPLIYHYGVPGQAVIVSSAQTSNVYNNQPVERYTVELQKADGQKIATHFDSSDFNVYPSRNQVRYPAAGQPFPVHYLASRPQSFVILVEGAAPQAER
ncbi:hypothetical protein [Bordetella genomosp. 4]|uniref:hypothetical protein n=1 Tax=Bordetella genomosp. 4 TaxID=463044 RepID=UPI000B9ED82E|nr:hypothetical protein [Bordetella genomosp. 4]OZI48547.1 hypothetical protein CAL21_11910 [Bordetella genomosp. 4]